MKIRPKVAQNVTKLQAAQIVDIREMWWCELSPFHDFYGFYPRGASDARVLASIVGLSVCVCVSVCYTLVLYQNG